MAHQEAICEVSWKLSWQMQLCFFDHLRSHQSIHNVEYKLLLYHNSQLQMITRNRRRNWIIVNCDLNQKNKPNANIPDKVYMGWRARFPVIPNEPRWPRNFCSGTPCTKPEQGYNIKRDNLQIQSCNIRCTRTIKHLKISYSEVQTQKNPENPTARPTFFRELITRICFRIYKKYHHQLGELTGKQRIMYKRGFEDRSSPSTWCWLNTAMRTWTKREVRLEGIKPSNWTEQNETFSCTNDYKLKR